MADRIEQEANSHARNLRDGPAGPTLYEQAQTSHSGSRRGHGGYERPPGMPFHRIAVAAAKNVSSLSRVSLSIV